MKGLQNFGNESLPSVIKDPFGKTNVERIYVSMSKSQFSPYDVSANGSIEFKNGNTKGEQKFEGKTFDEVVAKIKACLETL